ncbi:glycoside hydrolase family 36 protein [Glycomyces paridis]|uniref:Alpha-galactosidase n=1 Tax=Glycomyces paridis TaxID=2126555 RepID=A0A4S8P110_9ACTN|nr:glycoside hydrolase family 36 protein [Glycomyces paridis]THV23608.1 alpha-galactosidase [Glycomyces paridis]
MTVLWSTEDFTIELGTAAGAPVTIRSLRPAAGPARPPETAAEPEGPERTPPLVEVQALGHGRFPGSHRYTCTVLGSRLRYTGHELVGADLHVSQTDPVTGLTAVSVLSPSRRALRAWTVLHAGDAPVRVQAVTSLVLGTFTADTESPVDDFDVLWGDNDWVAESRWHRAPLREVGLPAMDPAVHHHMNRARMAVTTRSSWSTGERLPTGVLARRSGGYGLAFQIEHNGAWHWEVGEDRTGASLALLGPTDAEHQWSLDLAPGESFTSVPAAVTVVAPQGDPVDAALAALTTHRRDLVARTGTARLDAPLPVVFNDYMNTLMGDPTAAKILPLAEAAARAGADYYCIDAGWYDDDAGGWWDSVGEWEPSASRFPDGLAAVLDRIRELGMTPGIWLEPEVVGVRSPLAQTLPEDAFFQRGGARIVEHGRHQLDLRHPAVTAHLDAVVDRLVGMGVGFFKLDYNIMPGPGTDTGGLAPGAGLLEHCRAYLAWLDRVLARHPGLLIENCASGGMRADYATLSRLHLQSTSAQQDPLLYPPIAAATPASILPEQAGHWGYAQPEMSTEESAFTLVAGITGRLYLSGHLSRMDDHQLGLVNTAVAAHRALLPHVQTAEPAWPLGLEHRGPWQAFALHTDEAAVLTAWRLPGAPPDLRVPLPALRGKDIHIEQVFPAPDTPGTGAWTATWDGDALHLAADAPAPTARVLRLTWTGPGATSKEQQ